MIMVPLWEEEIVKGALWGKYPISSITELVDLEEDFGLYFQIVDDKGQYISRSNSKNPCRGQQPAALGGAGTI